MIGISVPFSFGSDAKGSTNCLFPSKCRVLAIINYSNDARGISSSALVQGSVHNANKSVISTGQTFQPWHKIPIRNSIQPNDPQRSRFQLQRPCFCWQFSRFLYRKCPNFSAVSRNIFKAYHVCPRPQWSNDSPLTVKGSNLLLNTTYKCQLAMLHQYQKTVHQHHFTFPHLERPTHGKESVLKISKFPEDSKTFWLTDLFTMAKHQFTMFSTVSNDAKASVHN